MVEVIPKDENYFLFTLLLTIVYQLGFFTIAVLNKMDKVTDLAGGSNFVALSIITWMSGGNLSSLHCAINALVLIWGIRLSGYLFYRIIKIDEDKRFDGTRENPLKFLGFWIFQMIWVWTVSLPVTFVNSIDNSTSLNFIEWIGIVLSSVGFLIESISDNEKFQFKMDPLNREKWCNVGFWKYSRHPNYFGELAFWWGVFILASRKITQHPWAYVTIISPVLITFLLCGFSGMPILEQNANRKFGHDPSYLQYRTCTSILIPMPPSVYKVLPRNVKAILFMEWALYERGLAGLTHAIVDSGQSGKV